MDQQPRRNEKDEKGRGEKQEKQEKGRPGDTLSGIIWGAVLVVAGLIFLTFTLNLFPGPPVNAWGVVFLAGGALFLLEAVIRLTVPAYRRPVTGTLIFAFILLAIGVGFLFGFQNIWPLIIIGIGVIILVGQFLRR